MNLPTNTSVRVAVALCLPFIMVLLLILSSLAYGQTENNLTVDFIDVGQGDSIYLHASDGTDILIDGGPPSAGPTVVAHLQDRGVDVILADKVGPGAKTLMEISGIRLWKVEASTKVSDAVSRYIESQAAREKIEGARVSHPLPERHD